MAVGEQHRRQLQEALVDRIGPGPADTLMSYLPPVGWADVATKQDVDALRVATQQDLQVLQAVMHAEMAELGANLRGEMAAQGAAFQAALRTQFYWTITLMVLLMSGFVAALKLV